MSVIIHPKSFIHCSAAILEKLSLTSIAKPSTSKDYYLTSLGEFKNKRARVSARTFLDSLSAQPGEAILAAFGIPWKPMPSVRFLPRNGPDREEWAKLPIVARSILQELASPRNELFVASYNKLKHGPQMVLMNVLDVITKKRGASIASLPYPEANLVRVLLRGARTQETNDETKQGDFVAPFLVFDKRSLEGVFYQKVFLYAMWVWRIACWIMKIRFNTEFPTLDPIVQRIGEKTRELSRLDLMIP